MKLNIVILTKQCIFRRILGGHLWASFRAFSSTKSRRAALGTPPILSTKNPANTLQIWLTEYAPKYALLSITVSSMLSAMTLVEDLRLRKRFGVGAGVAGQLAMMGVEADVNISEGASLGAGAGTGIDYNTSFVKLRSYLSGQWVSPYLAVSVARWWSSGSRVLTVRPSILANKFLEPGQNLAKGFDLWILSPGFGVQFMHQTGLSFYAELEYLFKVPTFVNGTYAGLGILWYF